MKSLAATYPPLNVHPIPDKTYSDSQQNEHNATYKEENRLVLVRLLTAFHTPPAAAAAAAATTRVLYLEGPEFPFTKKLTNTVFSSQLECHVVNWRAEDLLDSVTPKTLAGMRNNLANLTVFGASFGDFISSIHLRRLQLNYTMVWLDYCGVVNVDRLHEVDMLFEPGLLSTTQVVVVATTFCSKHDGTSPVAMDVLNGHEREKSLFRRAEAAAVHHDFDILDHLVHKDNGMLMMTYIVCHTSIKKQHYDRVRAVVSNIRGEAPLVHAPPPPAAAAPPPASLSSFFRLTKTGKIHREGVECSGVLVAEVRNNGNKLYHIPVQEEEQGQMCKFCNKTKEEEEGKGIKRGRKEEEAEVVYVNPNPYERRVFELGKLYTYEEDENILLYRKTVCTVEYIGPDASAGTGYHLFKTLAFPRDDPISLHESRVVPMRPEGERFTRRLQPGDTVEVKIKRRTDAATGEALDGTMHGTGVWVIGTCVEETTFGYKVRIPAWSSIQAPGVAYPTQIVHMAWKWFRNHQFA
jgi:hypothetical protein